MTDTPTSGVLGKPGCAACSWADNGCSHCNPRSVFDRMADDDQAEAALEQVPVDARAAAAVAELGEVLALPGGADAIDRAMTTDTARVQLQALCPPHLWDWAIKEVTRRCQAFIDARVEASQAQVAAIRSVSRDLYAAEVS